MEYCLLYISNLTHLPDVVLMEIFNFDVRMTVILDGQIYIRLSNLTLSGKRRKVRYLGQLLEELSR